MLSLSLNLSKYPYPCISVTATDVACLRQFGFFSKNDIFSGGRGSQDQHLPIRFLLYIAITALTRYLIGDVSHHKAPDIGLLYLCGGIFFLALSVLAVRFASYRFPSSKAIDSSGEVIGDTYTEK